MDQRAGSASHGDEARPPRLEDFELRGLLGAGGSASVFAALDRRDGTHVALKLLDAEAAHHPDRRAALLREAELAASVRHPGAIRVVASGASAPNGRQPRAWIAMELVRGVSLGDRVRKRGPLAPPEALALAERLLEVLDAAHRAGVVHRDVTPTNVMLGADPASALGVGDVRLIDFGLAAEPGAAAVEGGTGVLGNPFYLSPEHARGLPVHESGDLYQLGGVLHFALTGAPPFPGEDRVAVMRAHVSAAATPPSLLVPGLPRDVDALVLRALRKDPSARFGSAHEMLSAVAAARARLEQLGEQYRAGAAGAPGGAPDGAPAGTPGGSPIAATVLPSVHESVTDRLPIIAPSAPRGGARSTAGRERRQPRPRDDRGARAGARRGALPLGIAGLAVFAAALGLAVATTLQSGIAPGIASSSRTPVASPPPAAAAPRAGAPVVVPPRDRTREAAPVTMPAVLGLSLAEARARIEKRGLRIGEVTRDPSPRAADTVLASSETDGAELARGSEVRVTVASGSNRIPSVAGMTGQQARTALLSAGFIAVLSETPAPGERGPGGGEPGTGSPEPNAPQPGGETPPAPDWSDLVDHTTPGAGTLAPLGSTITLVTRAGTQPDPVPPAGSPQPAG